MFIKTLAAAAAGFNAGKAVGDIVAGLDTGACKDMMAYGMWRGLDIRAWPAG